MPELLDDLKRILMTFEPSLTHDVVAVPSSSMKSSNVFHSIIQLASFFLAMDVSDLRSMSKEDRQAVTKNYLSVITAVRSKHSDEPSAREELPAAQCDCYPVRLMEEIELWILRSV